MPNSKYYYYDKCICGRRKCTKSLHCKICANLKTNRKPSTIRKIIIAMKLRKITWDTFKGKHHTQESKDKMSLKHKGKKVSEITKKRISRAVKRLYRNDKSKFPRITEKTIAKHHINRNRKDERKSNLMYLTIGKHRKLHARAYDYLVKTGKIKQYIKWFLKQNFYFFNQKQEG